MADVDHTTYIYGRYQPIMLLTFVFTTTYKLTIYIQHRGEAEHTSAYAQHMTILIGFIIHTNKYRAYYLQHTNDKTVFDNVHLQQIHTCHICTREPIYKQNYLHTYQLHIYILTYYTN